MFRLSFSFFIFCLCACTVFAQPFIAEHTTNTSFTQTSIINPSFEGKPQMDAKNVLGWMPFNTNSTPDILPGPWGVQTPPYEGNTYIGLTTRSDNTWEAAVQKLNFPLQKDFCYQFTLQLALSDTYAGYNKPCRLRIWGSNSPNSLEKAQLLVTSTAIDHHEWRPYTLAFVSANDWQYIIIECFYKEATLLPYKGNILIDAWSIFEPCTRA